MIYFIYRNILLFVKDKIAVLFSFLAVFVVYFLYLCFLKDAMLKQIEPQFFSLAQEVCNTWIVAGTLGILTLTSSLSVLGVLISDRANHLLVDFQLTHLSSWKLTLGYILSTTILTFFICMVALSIGEAYIYQNGGVLLQIAEILKICGILWISIMACTSFLFCILIWFKSTSAFSNITTIIGTLSGFLMGIYLPIGALPIFLQHTIRLFPFSHATALLRQCMMENVVHRVFTVPNPTQEVFEVYFGLYFKYGDVSSTPWLSIGLLCCVTLCCVVIAHRFMYHIMHH